eukprot:scpid25094/ scgid16762/ 
MYQVLSSTEKRDICQLGQDPALHKLHMMQRWTLTARQAPHRNLTINTEHGYTSSNVRTNVRTRAAVSGVTIATILLQTVHIDSDRNHCTTSSNRSCPPQAHHVKRMCQRIIFLNF